MRSHETIEKRSQSPRIVPMPLAYAEHTSPGLASPGQARDKPGRKQKELGGEEELFGFTPLSERCRRLN